MAKLKKFYISWDERHSTVINAENKEDAVEKIKNCKHDLELEAVTYLGNEGVEALTDQSIRIEKVLPKEVRLEKELVIHLDELQKIKILKSLKENEETSDNGWEFVDDKSEKIFEKLDDDSKEEVKELVNDFDLFQSQ